MRRHLFVVGVAKGENCVLPVHSRRQDETGSVKRYWDSVINILVAPLCYREGEIPRTHAALPRAPYGE